MWSELGSEVIDDVYLTVGLGLAFWVVSWFLPFRRFAHRPEFRWDVMAVVCVEVFGFGAIFLLGVFFDPLSQLDLVAHWNWLVNHFPPWWVLLGNIILADFLAYWAHRLLHTRYIWPTHAWHHSPKVLYWASGLRGSPVHMVLLFLPYTVTELFLPTPEAALVGTTALVFGLANQHFIHSNIRLPVSRWLEKIFITPRAHFVHHSSTMSRTNSNYGFVFSTWDRLFGTWTDPQRVPEDDPLGLDYENSPWRLIVGLPPQVSTSKSRNGELPAASSS